MTAISKLVNLWAVLWSAVMLVGLALTADAGGEDQPSSEPARRPRAKSLDEQLLEDLSLGSAKRRDASDELSEDKATGNERAKPETRSLDDDLLEGLEGEDI